MQLPSVPGGRALRPARRVRFLRAAAATTVVVGLGIGLIAHTAAGPTASAASVPARPSHPLAVAVTAPVRVDDDGLPTAPPPTAPTAPPPPAATAAAPASSHPTAAPRRAPSRPSQAAPAPAPAVQAPAGAGPVAQTLALVNQDRASAGLPALVVDAGLARAAAEHAAQNATAGQMSHDGLFADVAQQGVSWHYLGECLGQVHSLADPNYVNTLWMQSSEHRSIILGSQYTHAGVGWARAADGDWFVSLIVDG